MIYIINAVSRKSMDGRMRKYHIADRKTVWEGKYLRCLEITYADPKGMLRKWESVERVNCDGIVAIVPVTDKGEVVLIRQFRPAVNSYVIEFPAGLNDRSERLEDAARRELLEETGFEPRELQLLAQGPLSSGSSGEILTVYFAKGLKHVGIQERDETEDIEVMEIPLGQVYENLARLAEEGNLIDLKIFGLIDLARKRGMFEGKV